MGKLTRTGALFFALSSLGCVTSGTYQRKENELAALRDASATRERAVLARQRQLENELASAKTDLATLSRKFAAVSDDRDVLRDVGANDRMLLAQLKKRLDSMGQNVEALTQEKTLFAAGLAKAYVRLKEVEEQKAAADQRAATYQDLVRKLQAMISAGTLQVVIRDGRMLIVMPNDVLFDSGRTEIKPTGKTALTAVAKALVGVSDRRFTVIGHTDDVPIHTARFRSNWDLSTARAVEVALFLASSGIKPTALAASGRSEFDPVGSNATEAGRQRNRRVEIALEPKLTELVADVLPAPALDVAATP